MSVDEYQIDNLLADTRNINEGPDTRIVLNNTSSEAGSNDSKGSQLTDEQSLMTLASQNKWPEHHLIDS